MSVSTPGSLLVVDFIKMHVTFVHFCPSYFQTFATHPLGVRKLGAGVGRRRLKYTVAMVVSVPAANCGPSGHVWRKLNHFI